MIQFRPLNRKDDDASNAGTPDDRTDVLESHRNVDLDVSMSSVNGVSDPESSRDIQSTAAIIRKLLKPVREKNSSKEAEEVRITRLYQYALQMSTDSDSSLEAIPLLESIVHSFLLRSTAGVPAHLKTIKFASCKHLGNLYSKSNNLEKAFKLFSTAVEVDSTDLGVWLKVAVTAIKLHKFNEAHHALEHIFREQPSHPLALYWAPPFYFAISQFPLCLNYAERCLLLDPGNQMALHCARRVLALWPDIEYVLEKLLSRFPNILKEGVVSEEAAKATDERIATIREGYMKLMDEFNKAEELQTVKFPRPLPKITWENLSHALCKMYDKLNNEHAILSFLDLGSLFEGGQLPSSQKPEEETQPPKVENDQPEQTNPSPESNPQEQPMEVIDVDHEDIGTSPDRDALGPGSTDPDVIELDSSSSSTNAAANDPNSQQQEEPQQNTTNRSRIEEEEGRRLSRRIRRSAFGGEDFVSITSLAGASVVMATPPGLTSTSAVGASNAGSAVGGFYAPGVPTDPRELQQLWANKASRFKALLPACFRNLSEIAEKTLNPSKLEQPETPDKSPDGKPESNGDNEDSTDLKCELDPEVEKNLVIEFLNVMAPLRPNAVLLGVSLLLQMTAHANIWSQSFSTAYLALCGRVRAALPHYIDSQIPEDTEANYPFTEERVLPALLLRIRHRPNLWFLAQVNMAYIEVRLDAMAVVRKAEDLAKRRRCNALGNNASRTNTNKSSEDVAFKTLSEALKHDSKRYWDPNETIDIPDYNMVYRLIDLMPEDSPETIRFQGRALYMRYEISAVRNQYDAMKDYLLQLMDFVKKHGPFRRLCSFRSNYITMEHIKKLLSEVEDISIGDRLQHLCFDEENTQRLVTALKECLRTHTAALRRKLKLGPRSNGKSSSSSKSVLTEDLPRICQMLHLPVTTLSYRLQQLYRRSSSPASVYDAVQLALQCLRLGIRVLSLFNTAIEDGQGVTENTSLSSELVGELVEAWRTVAETYELLKISWLVLDEEMDWSSKSRVSTSRSLTLETLCHKPVGSFTQDRKVLSLAYGELSLANRLAVDTFAWRLYATGALGLPLPEVSINTYRFIGLTFDKMELCFPLPLLHPKLRIYRALCDLCEEDIDQSTETALITYLTTHHSRRSILACARGHSIAPPSFLTCHLFHDLLRLVLPPGVRCCSSSTSTTLGISFLRNSALSVAELLSKLSEGYARFRLGGGSKSTSCVEEVVADTARLWPGEGTRLLVILAQLMHCMCGLPVKSVQGGAGTMLTSSRGGGGSGWDSDVMIVEEEDEALVETTVTSKAKPGSPSLDTRRFKQAVAPPELPARAFSASAVETEALAELPHFRALSSSTAAPASCVAPRPPLWLPDAAAFYGAVEDHFVTSHSASATTDHGGAWWLGAPPSDLDWQLIEVAFAFYRPRVIPEFDSVKSHSISSELANWLTAALELMPTEYEEFKLPEGQITACMTARAQLPSQRHYLSDMLNLVYYLLGDYQMKNNNFVLAEQYYKEDLRVAPHHPDSWAALALIYSSRLDQILNVTDPKTERVTSRAVTPCLRCFELALEIHPHLTTILTERGCLAYQIHSYATRLIKKSETRTVQEAHLRLCRHWTRRMLVLAYRSYGKALRLATATDAGVKRENWVEAGSTQRSEDRAGSSPVEEEWLYHYMLTKCEEKARAGSLFRDGRKQTQNESYGDWILRILASYRRTAAVLHAAGARYPRRITLYNKLPFLAVEAIEVYYRTHAFLLKQLILNQPPAQPTVGGTNPLDRLPLREMCEQLYEITQSPFITEAAKPTSKVRGRKRPSAMPEPPLTKVARTEGAPTASSTANTAAVPSSPPPAPSSVPMEIEGTQTVAAPSASTPPSDAEAAVTTTSTDVRPNFAGLSDTELWQKCVDYCREAMEQVLRRLPLHYKAMYRLAHLYLNAHSMQDFDKSIKILMGPLDNVTRVEYGGLFKDRKQSNFFHGVWRIPTSDIDRSGSFAAHMYRSVLMTLQVLTRSGDWVLLLAVFHQLRKQPHEDKRGFLGEGDRVFLARSAFSLIHPCLRLFLSRCQAEVALALQNPGRQPSKYVVTVDMLRKIFRLHCYAQSQAAEAAAAAAAAAAVASSGEEDEEEERTLEARSADVTPNFEELLEQAYRLCPAAWDSAGPNLEKDLILKRCADLAGPGSSASVLLTKSN